MDSLRQIAKAKGGELPDLWLFDPDLYEKDGRLQRDSTVPRLLAYSSSMKTLYVTDGCNSCAHALTVDLARFNASELEDFAAKTSIRLDLLKRLASESL
jgi:hypothetical protein